MSSKTDAPVYSFTKEVPEEGEGGPGSDSFGMLGMVLTVATMFTRSKIMAWVALFLVLSSIFNSKASQMDFGRVSTSLMFVVMSLVTVYMTPEGAPGPVEQITKFMGSMMPSQQSA